MIDGEKTTVDFCCGAGEGETLVFLHANGYTPRAYRQLLAPLAGRFAVHATGMRPLRPGAPPTRDWHALAHDLGPWLDAHYPRPVFAAGHSLGAIVLLLAAARWPARFRALALIEPVSLPRWATWLLRRSPAAIRARSPLAMAARGRSAWWPTREAAFDHARNRRAHTRIDDSVLEDILCDALEAAPGGGWTLRYTPEWEAQLFESPPDLRQALRAALPPVTVVRGAQSSLFSADDCARWRRRRPQDAITEIANAGHLVPFETPRAAAAALAAALGPRRAQRAAPALR